MIIGGIDQSTTSPAFGLLDMSDRRPRVMGHANLKLKPIPKSAFRAKHKANRMNDVVDWLSAQMRDAMGKGMTHVAIEDPRKTITGLSVIGITNHGAANTQLELFHRLTERARGMGLDVVHVEPKQVVRHLRLSLPKAPPRASTAVRAANQKLRRDAKKQQTANFVRLVMGREGLSEDENDALAHAFVGAMMGRAVPWATKASA